MHARENPFFVSRSGRVFAAQDRDSLEEPAAVPDWDDPDLLQILGRQLGQNVEADFVLTERPARSAPAPALAATPRCPRHSSKNNTSTTLTLSERRSARHRSGRGQVSSTTAWALAQRARSGIFRSPVHHRGGPLGPRPSWRAASNRRARQAHARGRLAPRAARRAALRSGSRRGLRRPLARPARGSAMPLRSCAPTSSKENRLPSSCRVLCAMTTAPDPATP